MLVLPRSESESVVINESIKVEVIQIRADGKVRLGITAPRRTGIIRGEHCHDSFNTLWGQVALCPGDPGYDRGPSEAAYLAACKRNPEGCGADNERIDFTIECEIRDAITLGESS